MKARYLLPLLVVFAGCTNQEKSSSAPPANNPAATEQNANESEKNSDAASSAALVELDNTTPLVKQENGLSVPRGFKIEKIADGLFVPRRIAFAPGATPQKYDVFVSESKADRVRVLRMQNGRVAEKFVFAEGLNQPYGLAFGNGFFYVANTDAVVRFPYKTGQTKANSQPQRVAQLTADGYNQHWTRNLLFSPDKSQLFVTVGSSCNTCEEDDPQRAAISVMKPDGSDKQIYATGLRNPVGMALQPGTNSLWTVVNERDNLGDNVPPDFLTKVEKGAFYGWPYAYTTIEGEVKPDPTFGSGNEDKVSATRTPEVPVQAHSAALGVAFYPQSGPFPKEFAGDAFLAYHGSWNRSERTGYKIVRVHFENGKPTKLSDFVTGYLKSDGEAWGRPVDVQIAPDGSLLFSDDGSGSIWRVTYAQSAE